MKTIVRLVLVLALAPLLLVNTPSSLAASQSFSGIIDSADPTMPVVFITTPNCTGQGATPVLYESTLLTVKEAGEYTISVSSPGGFASFYLYQGGFNPADGMTNCVAASNSGPLTITYPLTVGTTYYVVVIDDTFDQAGGTYEISVSGPGEICFNGQCAAGCDVLLAIPDTAVGATFVANAEVYWTPGQLTSPLVVMEAGKSVRAIGLDATGEYYQIIFECDYLWVKANTLGPNYDAVWQGRPLPTNVVH